MLTCSRCGSELTKIECPENRPGCLVWHGKCFKCSPVEHDRLARQVEKASKAAGVAETGRLQALEEAATLRAALETIAQHCEAGVCNDTFFAEQTARVARKAISSNQRTPKPGDGFPDITGCGP